MTATRVRTRKSRRWIRAVLPLAVVLALTAFTVIVHIVQQSDPTDRDFLSPVSTAGVGSATLAGQLRARGVTIDRETATLSAYAAISDGPATLFVPTPGLVYPDYLGLLRSVPAGTHVVIVAPQPAALSYAGLEVAVAGPRWTAAAVASGCAGGTAAVLRWRYRAPGRSCYAGGVLELRDNGATMTLVGAPDPFRNDRLAEHHNAALSVGLLARAPRVVWLDLHDHERPPDDPIPAQDETAPREGTPTPRGESPTDEGRPGDGGDQGGGDRGQGDPEDGGTASPSDDRQVFPPAVWATLALLALAAIALAAAHARRLGAPVAEPLPVRVRAAETVRGLGSLYRRARADESSLATIQAAARRRLAAHFDCSPDEIAVRAAAVTGQPADDVERLLTETDGDVTSTAAAVQDLVRHITEEKMT
jgi:hypothetical protein